MDTDDAVNVDGPVRLKLLDGLLGGLAEQPGYAAGDVQRQSVQTLLEVADMVALSTNAEGASKAAVAGTRVP